MSLAAAVRRYASISLLLGTSACGTEGGPPSGDLERGVDADEAALVVVERIAVEEPGFPFAAPFNMHVVASFTEPVPPSDIYPVEHCVDAWPETTPHFPTAQDPDRVYLDVGEVTVTGQGLLPLTAELREFSDATIPKRDFLGRQHSPPGAVSVGVPSSPTDMTNPLPHVGFGDTRFDVEVAGSDTYSGPTAWPGALYLPPAATVGPDAGAPIPIVPGEPLVFTFEPGPTDNAPDGLRVLNFVGLVAGIPDADPPEFYVSTFCTTTQAEMTIPPQVVGAFLQGGSGLPAFVLRGHLAHRIIWFDDDDPSRGRFDLMGFNAYGNTIAVEGL